MTLTWRLACFLAAFFPLLGLKRGFSLIGILLALHGWWLLATQGRQLAQQPAVRQAALVGAGFVVPLILALPDANFFQHSLLETTMAVLYLPMLLSVLVLVARHELTIPFMRIAVWVAVFWSLDACLQQVWGRDLFGMPLSDRAGGYWQTPAKFGFYMGFFGLFAWLCDMHFNPGKRWRSAALWLVLTAGVLVGVNRASWLVFFPASALIFWFGPLRDSRWRLPLVAGVLVLGGLVAAAAWRWSVNLRTRVEQTLTALNGSYEAIDHALSHRLGIWLPAWDLSLDHWFNGMGQDGFLKTFMSVTPDPVHLQWGIEMHPHQVLLEVSTTTGLLGFLGLSLLLAVMRKAWREALPAARVLALPFLVYLAAFWFPLNTHRSLYSSELMMGNWMMLGFYFAILSGSGLKQGVART